MPFYLKSTNKLSIWHFEQSQFCLILSSSNVEQIETSTTKTSTNQNVDKPKRRQTKMSTNQNVARPKRRQTKTSTNRNVDKPKRRQTKTLTTQNVDRPKRRHFIKVHCMPICIYLVGCTTYISAHKCIILGVYSICQTHTTLYSRVVCYR